jgi:hypothetical protein
VTHERVGGDPQLEQLAVVAPLGGEHAAREADVLGLGGGERGEVVRARQQRGAGVQRLAVDAVRVVQRAAVLEGARLAAGEDAEAVGAARGVAAGVEAVGGALAGEDRDVVRGQRVEAVRLDRRARVRGDLPPGVDPAVGPPGDGQRRGLAQQRGQRALDLGLHGAAAGLARPSGEVRAVVLEEEPGDHDPPCCQGWTTRSSSTAWRPTPGPRPRPTSGRAGCWPLRPG